MTEMLRDSHRQEKEEYRRCLSDWEKLYKQKVQECLRQEKAKYMANLRDMARRKIPPQPVDPNRDTLEKVSSCHIQGRRTDLVSFCYRSLALSLRTR
jgi:hypothetical protein